VNPSWRQTIVAALLIAFVAAAAVWFLEDFQRRATVEMMREQWAAWLDTLPMRGEGK
jgi:putative SOS response-associated peptidase YedK